MKLVEWTMQGREFVNCNCAFGCPCQFNSLPTHGNCCAYSFVQIDKGYFDDVTLDGLRWGVLIAWPGAIHEGNGTFQAIIEERADARQRAAIESVAQGKETETGKLIWQVFSTTVTKVLPTIYRPIDLNIDLKARKFRVNVPGVVEGSGDPIRNELSNAEMPIRLTLPAGFEFREADIISGTGRTAKGSIQMDFKETHGHVAAIHWSTHGLLN